MADKKISQLTALSAANLAPSTDVLAIVDTSATETKKIVAQDLINGVLNVASAVGIGTSSPVARLDVFKTSSDTISRTNAVGAFGDYVSLGAGLLLQQTLSSPYGFALQAANAANSVQFPLLLNPSGGNVGIGTASPAYKLDVNGNAQVGNATAATNRFLYINGVANKAGAVAFQESGVNRWLIGNGAASENGNFEIYDATNGNNFILTRTGNLGIGVTPVDANNACLQLKSGITFPATQSASSNANTLDDYEEGTFTPVISGTTTAGTGTYNVQNGAYVKIGNLVQYQIYIILTAHTGTGNITITGLPFTAIAGHYPPAAVYVDNLALTANNYPQIAVSTSSTTFLVRQVPVGGGAATAIPMDTQFDILLSGTYQV